MEGCGLRESAPERLRQCLMGQKKKNPVKAEVFSGIEGIIKGSVQGWVDEEGIETSGDEWDDKKKERKKKTTWQQQWSPLESPSNKSSTKKYLYLPQVSLSGFYSTTLLLRAPAGVCETASLNDTSAVRVPKPKCIGRSMALWIWIAFNCLSATRRHFEAIIYYSNSVYDKWYREK